MGNVSCRFGPRSILIVGEGEVAHAKTIERANYFERLPDTMPALGSQQGSDPARSKCVFDLLSTRREGEPVWVMLDHSVDKFYLFDRCGYGIGALEPAGHIYRPKLPPDTTALQAHQIRLQTWLETI